MISLKQLLTEDKKVKIYVQKGKKPPKGKSLKKGPRGGSYFVGSPKEKQTYEKGGSKKPASKPASKPKVNIFDKPTKKKPIKKAVKTSALKVPKEYDTDNTYDMANHVADNFAKLVDRKTLPKDWEDEGLDKNNIKRIEKYLKSVFKPGEENEEIDDQFLENFWDDFGSVDTQAMPSSGITTVSGGQAMPGSGKTIVSKTQDRDWFGDDEDEGHPDDFSEASFKMDKYMPDDPDTQDEYYNILATGDVEALTNFFDENADYEVLQRYMPRNKTSEDFAKYLIGQENMSKKKTKKATPSKKADPQKIKKIKDNIKNSTQKWKHTT